jgi:hypothetical protein
MPASLPFILDFLMAGAVAIAFACLALELWGAYERQEHQRLGIIAINLAATSRYARLMAIGGFGYFGMAVHEACRQVLIRVSQQWGENVLEVHANPEDSDAVAEGQAPAHLHQE